MTLLQECYKILVSQVAEHPLKPNHIVLVLELKLLQTLAVVAILGHLNIENHRGEKDERDLLLDFV